MIPQVSRLAVKLAPMMAACWRQTLKIKTNRI